jgi:hypothetical protein
MTKVPRAPARAKSPRPFEGRAALLWEDPGEIRAWLGALREQTRDLASAAEDATRRLGERVLSRGEARRRIEAASHAVEDLLQAAERGVV